MDKNNNLKIVLSVCVLLIFLCITFSKKPSYAAYSINVYLDSLSKLEIATSYSNEKIIEYISGKDTESTRSIDEEYPELASIKNIKTVSTPAGNVNIYQLIRGVSNGASVSDIRRFADKPSSAEFLTAMDEYNIGTVSRLSVGIRNYYSSINEERRIRNFVEKFYAPSSMKKSTFQNKVSSVNKKYDISNSSGISDYLYNKFPDESISYLSISGDRYIGVGSAKKLNITVQPWSVKYSQVGFSSSDSSVISVNSNGEITGHKEGTAVITASLNGHSDSITIQAVRSVTALTDLTNTNKLFVGETTKMKISISPEDATVKSLTFLSSNNYVATVDADGTVSANHGGYATITARSHNGIYVKHEFKILQEISKIETPDSLEIVCGNSEHLKTRIYPNGLTDNEVKYESDNNNIVSVDEDGKLYAKKNGTATVKVYSVRHPDIFDVTKVTVVTKMKKIVPDEIQFYYMGHNEKFKYDVQPKTTSNKKLKYEMKENEYASVREDGSIVPKKLGQTEVTVHSTDGTNLTKTVTIYIKQAIEKISVKNIVYLKKGEKFTLYYTIEPANSSKKTVKLISSDKEKVSIKGGKIVAKAHGKTKVLLRSSDPEHATAECYVIVKRPLWHYIATVFCVSCFIVFIVKYIRRRKK